jgi:hypothetical protein
MVDRVGKLASGSGLARQVPIIAIHHEGNIL